jgi:hypothetical protein
MVERCGALGVALAWATLMMLAAIRFFRAFWWSF